jgi:hypothetical protein
MRRAFLELMALARGVLAPARLARRPRRADPSPPEARPAAAESASLRALTAAALALPGLAQTAHAAEGDELGFQYGHYKESSRNLYGVPSAYNPIEVDNLTGSGSLTLFDRWKFAFNFIQDTWSGATPITSAPMALGSNNYPANNPNLTGATPLILGNGTLLYDQQYHPYRYNLEDDSYVKDTRLVQTIAAASPETRQQGDFRLGYEWDEAAAWVNGGLSEEPDYHSAFAGLGGRLDLNQKLTTLNLGLDYTNSDISATLDPSASAYYDYSAYDKDIKVSQGPYGTINRVLRTVRQDWSTRLGITQTLSKDALVETGVGYTRSTGYLANPYKVAEFVFVDPSQTPEIYGPGLPPLLVPYVQAVLEQRPDSRDMITWEGRYVQYIQPLDAALHLGYRFYHDSWGIDAHTFKLDWDQPLGRGWTVTPHFRYYSQTAANFYQNYFLFKQAEPTDASGQLDLARTPIKNYSSDYRLSGFGALGGGVTVTKQLNKALTLEGNFEYYTHDGGLKLGGGGEGSYANFDYYQFNAGVRVDLSAPFSGGDSDDPHAHHHHGGHPMAHAPAGVLFSHMLENSGEAMVGYRYMYSLQGGQMLNGTNSVSDPVLLNQGCGKGLKCTFAPTRMVMNMHMVDLMYAPTDWLTLMLMPQFMDMDMDFRQIDGASPPPSDNSHNHGGTLHHSTGGVGDIGLYALFELWEATGHRLHTSLGFTAPSGDAGLKVPSTGEFYDYGMQLGSGVWDFRPSLTYTGHQDAWSWGAQVNATVRLGTRNEFGYTPGDLFQTTAWGGYSFLDWLSGSLRGVYTAQGDVNGYYNGPHSLSATFDIPSNFGGHYWDLGFGLAAAVPDGAFKGNQVAVEWLQPLFDDPHGYQLTRTGMLSATWSLAF